MVVEGCGHNTTKAGKQYNNRYCLVFRIAQGNRQSARILESELKWEAE